MSLIFETIYFLEHLTDKSRRKKEEKAQKKEFNVMKIAFDILFYHMLYLLNSVLRAHFFHFHFLRWIHNNIKSASDDNDSVVGTQHEQNERIENTIVTNLPSHSEW